MPETLFEQSSRPEACNFIKKSLWHTCFSVDFAKFLRTPFLTEHLRTTASDITNITNSLCCNFLKMYLFNFFVFCIIKNEL